MKVLLDEMLPAGLAGLLPDHDVTTVRAAGYAGLANGQLLRAAASAGYAVLVTADRNLPAQQNIPAAAIAVLLVPGSRMSEMRSVAGPLRDAVATIQPGSVVRLTRSSAPGSGDP